MNKIVSLTVFWFCFICVEGLVAFGMIHAKSASLTSEHISCAILSPPQTPLLGGRGQNVFEERNFQNFLPGSLCDETKILTDTKTETFYPRQIFPIPKPRLFFRYQIFRDRYRDFFPRPNFPILIPRLSFRDQIFRYRYRDNPKNCHGSRD